MAEHDVRLDVRWNDPPVGQPPPDPIAGGVRAAVAAAYLDTMKASLDRSIKRVELVTAAAAAVGTIYTGVLALRFGPADDETAITAWAVAPAVALGLAVVLALGYRAFLPGRVRTGPLLPHDPDAAVRAFVEWAAAGVRAGSWMLRAAVLALSTGIATLPAPFLDAEDAGDLVLAVVTADAVLVLLALLVGGWPVASGGTVPEEDVSSIPTPTGGPSAAAGPPPGTAPGTTATGTTAAGPGTGGR
ncbi:MAG: hypothetical protein AB7H43_00365 [Acidimicrobiia bacterium]